MMQTKSTLCNGRRAKIRTYEPDVGLLVFGCLGQISHDGHKEVEAYASAGSSCSRVIEAVLFS